MAKKTQSTFARAQAALSKALKDFEASVSGMMHSAPAPAVKKAKKARKAKKTKTKKARAK